MPRCDYQNKRCDEYGYPREEYPDRHLCGKHYEELIRMHNSMVRAYKKAGVSLPGDKEFGKKRGEGDKE